MALFDFEKKEPEISPLRLVSDNKDPQSVPVIELQFVNFIFFRVNPDWRKLNADTKRVFKGEFQSVFNKYNEHLYKRDQIVKLRKDNRVWEAKIKSVSKTGKLITDPGIEEEFEFGEIEWVM